MKALYFAMVAMLAMSGSLLAQDDAASPSAVGAGTGTGVAADVEAELTQFKKDLYAAFNAGQYEEMLNKYCHRDVVATWQDGNVSHGHAEVLAEFRRLSEIIEKIQVDPTVEHRLVLNDGNLVISTGKMNDTYKLKRGETVALESRWSGTMVREDGKWTLISFSGVANSFDNPVIRLFARDSTQRLMLLSGLGGLALGGLVGFLVLRSRSK